jgi:hypothetical protein
VVDRLVVVRLALVARAAATVAAILVRRTMATPAPVLQADPQQTFKNGRGLQSGPRPLLCGLSSIPSCLRYVRVASRCGPER